MEVLKYKEFVNESLNEADKTLTIDVGDAHSIEDYVILFNNLLHKKLVKVKVEPGTTGPSKTSVLNTMVNLDITVPSKDVKKAIKVIQDKYPFYREIKVT